ncbi:MAG: hypothetical protein U0401_34570 [Anaerolineae bacterium]
MKKPILWILLQIIIFSLACNLTPDNPPISSTPISVATPVTAVQTIPVAATPTQIQPIPTTAPTVETPASTTAIQRYEDPLADLALNLPETWIVASSQPGQSAIFQSFPQTKYVGGEPFEPGNAKCDLLIYPAGAVLADELAKIKADTTIRIISEHPYTLKTGESGFVLNVSGFGGESVQLLTNRGERVVSLGCFGNLTPFEELAASLTAVN